MIDLRYYDVILSPVITEKSTAASEYNQVIFNVSRGATKEDIKSAIEKIFSVRVVKVNTLTRKGKVKHFRRLTGCQKDIKKAIITLADGSIIDVSEKI